MDGQSPKSNSDNDTDEHTRPGIAPPGRQPDQAQQLNAPPQRQELFPDQQPTSRTQWIPPTTGNPDLDPAGIGSNQRLNPLAPQGMLYDPRQLLDAQRQSPQTGGTQPDIHLPPGARFDPFGPPDPSQVGPGRPPLPSYGFGGPDPDHFQPPGMPQLPGSHKSIKKPGWPPGGPPGGGPSGGGPFL